MRYIAYDCETKKTYLTGEVKDEDKGREVLSDYKGGSDGDEFTLTEIPKVPSNQVVELPGLF